MNVIESVDDKINIPINWKEYQLGDVATITMGQSPSSTTYNEKGVGVLLVQGNADIKQRKTKPRIWTSEPTNLCKVGDIIMTVRAPVGAIAKSEHDACIGRGVCAIKSTKMDSEFLFQLLISYEDKWKALEQGSTFTAVNGKDIRGIKINIPPIYEQQKIATILNTIDNKIEVIDDQIKVTEKLKKGLMRQLFTKGIGHIKFKDSAFGEIPENWEVYKLDKLVDKVGSGITPKGGFESYLKQGILFLRSQNVLIGKLKLSDVAYISEEQHAKMKNSQIKTGDVLLNITGASIGRSCVVPNNIIEGNVNQHVCIIRPSYDLHNIFLCQFLNSSLGQSQIDKFQAGGNREGLNFQQIRSFDIPLPPKLEQIQISEIIHTINEKSELLKEKKDYFTEFKKGLMQKLLTGKIRFTHK